MPQGTKLAQKRLAVVVRKVSAAFQAAYNRDGFGTAYLHQLLGSDGEVIADGRGRYRHFAEKGLEVAAIDTVATYLTGERPQAGVHSFLVIPRLFSDNFHHSFRKNNT